MMRMVYGKMRRVEEKGMRGETLSGRSFKIHIRNLYNLINKRSRLRTSAIHGLAKKHIQTTLAMLPFSEIFT